MKTNTLSALEIFKQEELKMASNELSSAEYLCWDDDLIHKYRDFINWDLLSANTNLKWSRELIMRYEDKWAWRALSYIIANVLEEMDFRQIIFIYQDRISWSIICQGINITPETVRDYPNKIDWQSLSGNSLFNWDGDFVHYHRRRIDWSLFSATISAVNLQKSNTNINYYITNFVNYWDLNELSENSQLIFDIELLKALRNLLNWELLINNESVVWSFDMLEEFNAELSLIPAIVLKDSFFWQRMHKVAGDRFRDLDLEFMLPLF